MKWFPFLAALFTTSSFTLSASGQSSGNGWLEFAGGQGTGKGKHIVLLAGDEEYRSEEAMPMLAGILSKHHGFRCTVLFSVSGDGVIDPNRGESLGRPETLDSADLIVMSLRFRKWPDEAMKHFDAAIQRGVPIIGLRTSTHAFQFPKGSTYERYNQFGKEVLGEEWVSHWGHHKHEATQGVLEAARAADPLLRGVSDVFGDSDVYEAYPPKDAVILMRGRVLKGMNPNDEPAVKEKTRATDKGVQDVNEPMMPVAWYREVKNPAGTSNRVLCTTMGAATDLANEGLRRLVVNGVFWGLGMEVPEKAEVTPDGPYVPSAYKFNGARGGMKAEDFAPGGPGLR